MNYLSQMLRELMHELIQNGILLITTKAIEHGARKHPVTTEHILIIQQELFYFVNPCRIRCRF